MTRSEILNRADEIINGERQTAYGSAENNFQLIADLWSDYLDTGITAKDVALMMTLFKIARCKTGVGSDDSYIDACGYMAIGGEISSNARQSSQEIIDKLGDEGCAKLFNAIFHGSCDEPEPTEKDHDADIDDTWTDDVTGATVVVYRDGRAEIRYKGKEYIRESVDALIDHLRECQKHTVWGSSDFTLFHDMRTALYRYWLSDQDFLG